MCPRAAHPLRYSRFIAGYVVPPFYDLLLGKLIVWGHSRQQALERMHETLSQVQVEGIKTTVRCIWL